MALYSVTLYIEVNTLPITLLQVKLDPTGVPHCLRVLCGRAPSHHHLIIHPPPRSYGNPRRIPCSQELPGRNSHQDEEPVDREEVSSEMCCVYIGGVPQFLVSDATLVMLQMMNSLRCLRNHAAKKRAKVSASGSDPERRQPDSAVKLEPSTDSPSHTSPSLTSPLSESSLSSLYSPPTSTITNGTKIR
ncbi:hypothetical protein P4O66_023078 [Electrophorus voltai]|uniref:Uncharacterized protein n=1 Tax=Electrophorus voltai TaxID=2609070 RepID=A0AAD9E1Z2_9TELE|nr:hypothetical protein P4O66_023078 [Electrophorus voltai]